MTVAAMSAKQLVLGGLGAAALMASALPLLAASACDDVLQLDDVDGENDRTCIDAIMRDTSRAGYRAADWNPNESAARFYIGGGVVTVRCLRGQNVTLSAVHPDDGQACLVLQRIRDAITSD